MRDDANTGEKSLWRGGFKFLYELYDEYRYYKTTSRRPRFKEETPKFTPGHVQLKCDMCIIYFALFLIPEWLSILAPACHFILYILNRISCFLIKVAYSLLLLFCINLKKN